MEPAKPPLDPEDRPFEHYSRKHRIVAWISKNLFDHVTYTVPSGLLQGLKRKGGLGWLPADRELSKEQKFLLSLNLEGKTIYDVGAFHGLLTMFFAKRGARVVAYEPNPVNRRRVEENLALNNITNVTLRPYGLSAVSGAAKLSFDPLLPGGGSIQTGTAAAGSSRKVESIELRSLDDEIAAGLPFPDFIKIDVEGREHDVLKGAGRVLARGPALFLEMHGETMREKKRKTAEIVEILNGFGYDIQHVESDQVITPRNSDAAARGHLYCPARQSVAAAV